MRGLANITKLPDEELSQTAERFVKKIYNNYFGDSSIYRSFNDSVDISEVVKQLTSENFANRKRAVYTIRRRKIYSQIPTLIDKISIEQDLDVLASIEFTLNELLEVTYHPLLDEDAQTKYRDVWDNKKATLLIE